MIFLQTIDARTGRPGQSELRGDHGEPVVLDVLRVGLRVLRGWRACRAARRRRSSTRPPTGRSGCRRRGASARGWSGRARAGRDSGTVGLGPQCGGDVDPACLRRCPAGAPAPSRARPAGRRRSRRRSCARKVTAPVATPRWPQLTACCTARMKLSDVGPIPVPTIARPTMKQRRDQLGNEAPDHQHQAPQRHQAEPTSPRGGSRGEPRPWRPGPR